MILIISTEIDVSTHQVIRAKAYFLLRKIKSNSLILSCLIKLFFVYCIDYQTIKQYEKR